MPMLRNKLPFFIKQTVLPSAYRKIDGMTMNDNCYFAITGFRLSGSDTLRFSFSATGACNVLGCYTTTSAQTNYSLYVSTSSGSKYMRYNGGTYDSYITANTKYNVIMTPTGATGLNTSPTWTQQTFTTESDFCVGTTSTGATSAKLKGTLYGSIEVKGRLKLIPCIRLSDSVVGYFDMYSRTFYEPTGTNPTPYYSEVTFIQPVLVRDGTLGGNDFAVSASAIYGTGYEAFRAFDHVSSTAWGITAQNDFPCDFIMYYPDAFNITSLRWQVLDYNRRLKDWELYGSNDGTNYTFIDSGTGENSNDVTLTFSYSGYYKYYKLKIISGYNGVNAKEVTLTGKVKLKGEMTFAAPYLTSSGTLGGDSFAVLGDAFSSYYDWQIFADDANSSATKTWAYNSRTADYIFYNPDALKVSSLDIVNRDESTPRAIVSGTVYGSNDGTNWTELTTFTNDVTSRKASWSIAVNSTTYYKYHKINCSSSGTYVGIGKLIIHATYRPS